MHGPADGLVVQDDEAGLRDATWVLDGTAVRAAAFRARPFWNSGV
ncbi:hypothetical protein [Streptomyces sp. NPDC056883]